MGVVVLAAGGLGNCHFRIFLLNVDELVIVERHVLFDEVINCLAETDFVVERWRSYEWRRLAISFRYLDSWCLLIHLVIEFSNHDFFNVLVACCFKYNQLMSNYSISNLFLLCWIKVVRLGYFMHLGFTPCLNFCCGIQNGNHIALLITTSILVIWSQRTVEWHLHLGLLLVDVAIAHLWDVVEDVATVALEDV